MNAKTRLSLSASAVTEFRNELYTLNNAIEQQVRKTTKRLKLQGLDVFDTFNDTAKAINCLAAIVTCINIADDYFGEDNQITFDDEEDTSPKVEVHKNMILISAPTTRDATLLFRMLSSRVKSRLIKISTYGNTVAVAIM